MWDEEDGFYYDLLRFPDGIATGSRCVPWWGCFHGDNGAGLGANHQTGWTGLVAKFIQLYGLLDATRTLEGGKMTGFQTAKG